MTRSSSCACLRGEWGQEFGEYGHAGLLVSRPPVPHQVRNTCVDARAP